MMRRRDVICKNCNSPLMKRRRDLWGFLEFGTFQCQECGKIYRFYYSGARIEVIIGDEMK